MNLLPGWLPHSNTVNLLAGAFLLSALLVVTRRRPLEVVGALRANAIALALIALTVSLATGTWHIALAALLAFVVKAGVRMDLMAGVALLGLFVQRLEDAVGDGDTSSLTRLRG